MVGLKDVVKDCWVLIVEINGVGIKYLLFGEKLLLVLIVYKVDLYEVVFKWVNELFYYGGLGYIVGIYMIDDVLVKEFGL